MIQYKDSIVLFGGRKLNKEAPFADSVYLLGLGDLTWTRLIENKDIH